MSKHIILFLAANPLGTTELALGREARAIQDELERSGQRDRFEFVTRWATHPLDLLRELRKLKPTVVHFSGHGGSGGRRQGAGPRRDILVEPGDDGGTDDTVHQGGLFFQGLDDRPQLVTAAALRDTFGAVTACVKLVVLNACYSDIHAEALLVHIDCVVGMGGSLRDDAARTFAIGFYGGLGERQSVAAAYRQGCAAISLEEPSDGDRPQLRVRDGVDAEQVVLAEINPVDRGVPGTSDLVRSPATAAAAAHVSSSHGADMPVSTPSMPPPVPARPIPAYPNAEVEHLSKQLEEAQARRDRLRSAGIAADDLDREILELRRQLREGGQLRAGDALSDGRYLLVKIVGRGGFAVVWEAYDCAAQQRVAIKVLHSNLAGDPLCRERFFRGARAMMNLAHPGLVRVLYPKEEDGGFHYFVMEFVPGGDLRETVLKGRLRKDEIWPLMLQVGEALAAAHARRMIHRDVKPSNIMLDHNGHAKLTDFDLVGAHDTTGGTRTGALGTVVYAAPECLERPQDATARADVYGLGMTMIFCLSGRELSLSTFRNSEPTIARLDCPSRIRKVIQKAVAWEPHDRFADATIMMLELRNALRLPDQAGIAVDEQRQTEFRKLPIDGGLPVQVNKDELLKLDKTPAQYRPGSRIRRWFTYIVSALGAVSVAAGVTFMIIRLTRNATPTTGSVRVVSVPTGANVTFDDTLFTDRSPLTIDLVPVGTRHKITVSLRHYQPYTEEVSIPKTGGTVQMVAQLTSLTGKIVINTTPGGAQIVINGQPRGTTPTTLSGIDIDSTPSLELLHKDFGKYAVPLKWDAAGVAYVDYKFSH